MHIYCIKKLFININGNRVLDSINADHQPIMTIQADHLPRESFERAVSHFHLITAKKIVGGLGIVPALDH